MLTGQQQQQHRAVLLLLPAGPPPPTSLPPGPRHLKKKRPSSTSTTESSKRAEVRPQVKSVSGPKQKHTDDLSAREEKYKLLNAELEAKTAELVRQADQLMREQSEVLSKPLSTLLLTDIEDEEDSRIIKSQQCTVEPVLKVVTKKRPTSTSHITRTGTKGKESHSKTASLSRADESAAAGDSGDLFLAKTIHSMEEKMKDMDTHDNVVDDHDVFNTGDNVGSAVSDAQIRVLKAKLRIMQEELDQLSCECYRKDDQNAELSAKIKEMEEERARLHKTTSIQHTQIEKHKALAEESDKKCNGLQLQVSGFKKEIENLNRSNKQAAAVHSTAEVRLNRALEEVERLKTQLNKMKQMNKDNISEDHQSKEKLLAENKMLKKQKAELVVGFKKQLKLIDILQRQKMHFEAAKLLSFREEEFLKALDWGKF
nr:PREDICTED: testis-expressed sequence 9 protein isoform X1 [Paralichthys olivaceus]